MKLLKTTTRKLAASATGAVLLAGPATTAGAVTQAAPAQLAGASAPASLQILSSTAPKPPRHRPAPALRRMATVVGRTDHATFEVKRKGAWVTLTYDRGKVTSASSSSITLLRPDGHSVTIALASTTRYRGVASAGAIATNKPAAVISDNGTAILVGQPKKAPAKPAPANPSSPAAPRTSAS